MQSEIGSVQPVSDTAFSKRQLHLLVTSTLVGTTLETFDFNVYSLLTVLVFNQLFFPQLDPGVATIASFGVFAIGLLSRPLGGLVFGHYGDRIGRKPTMVITLALMGLSTAAIGLTPSYQSVGILAPIILTVLRFFQGVAFGGETSVSPVYVSESAPRSRRGFYSALAYSGILGGVLLAAGSIKIVALLPSADLLSWGWRIPFLLSILIVAVGMYIRLKIEESPSFVARISQAKPFRMPVIELLRSYRKPAITSILVAMSFSGLFFFFSVFGLSYGVQTLHLSRATMLQGIIIGNIIGVIIMPLSGLLSDTIGRRPIMITTFIVTALYAAFGFFRLLQTGETNYIMVATAITPILNACSLGPVSAFLSELFPDARVRFTGVGMAQIGYMLGGALVPLFSAILMAMSGNNLTYPILLFMGFNLVSALACYLSAETKSIRI
jgi:MFS family permease